MQFNSLSRVKVAVLLILCLQNSLFTVVRRYSQGVLKESYSKHEVLLFGEVVKMAFSAFMISSVKKEEQGYKSLKNHLYNLMMTSKKMFALSLIYGLMNILSYVALRNISASLFTICAQLKILTTATFSCVLLNRKYSMVKWRALLTLSVGVLLFSEPVWNDPHAKIANDEKSNVFLGTMAVLTEVTLSGFASIYFEKVIKTDPEQLNIWERNFQLAFGSFPVYLTFICFNGGDKAGYFGGWTYITHALALLGASGGLLVALSIKYGDAILKTLATTGAIVLSSILDHVWLGGPMTTTMMLAGCIVVLAIFDYTFDPTGQMKIFPLENKESKDDCDELRSSSAEFELKRRASCEKIV